MDLSGTRLLLDTTALIHHMKGQHPELEKYLEEARLKQLFVGYSIITEMELWVGVAPNHPNFNEAKHEALIYPYVRVFVNSPIARRAGYFKIVLKKQGKDPGVADCLIAATAEHYKLTILSHNSRHFPLFESISPTIKTLLYV